MGIAVWHKSNQAKTITKGGLKASSPVRFAADGDHRFTEVQGAGANHRSSWGSAASGQGLELQALYHQ